MPGLGEANVPIHQAPYPGQPISWLSSGVGGGDVPICSATNRAVETAWFFTFTKMITFSPLLLADKAI